MLRRVQICCTDSMKFPLLLRTKRHDKLWLQKALFCSKPMENIISPVQEHIETNYVPKYSKDEQIHILRILNNSTVEELERFDVTKKRVKSLVMHRKKKGPFLTLNQVLEVEGMGVKVFDNLCVSIIECDNSGDAQQVPKTTRKVGSNLINPSMNEDKRAEIKSATGIFIGGNAVSWAQLNRNGTLTKWDWFDYSDWPEKMDLTAMLDLAVQIRAGIVESEVYVMENVPAMVASTTHIASLKLNLQRQQLSAMIVALLATKFNQPNSGGNVSHELMDNCYFLRSRLPARLFRIMVGTEKVSAQTVVQEILNANKPKEITHLSPIEASPEVRWHYEASDNIKKEALSQALILVAAFFDLVIHRNPISLKKLSR